MQYSNKSILLKIFLKLKIVKKTKSNRKFSSHNKLKIFWEELFSNWSYCQTALHFFLTPLVNIQTCVTRAKSKTPVDIAAAFLPPTSEPKTFSSLTCIVTTPAILLVSTLARHDRYRRSHSGCPTAVMWFTVVVLRVLKSVQFTSTLIPQIKRTSSLLVIHSSVVVSNSSKQFMWIKTSCETFI